MLRKLMVTGAVLALLVLSSVPALAQLLTNEPGATGNAPVSQDAVSPEVDIDLAPVGDDNPPGPVQYSTVETVPSGPCEQSPQDIRCRNGFDGLLPDPIPDTTPT